MFLKQLFALAIITTSAYAVASDQNQTLLQEALEQGKISPCTIALEIQEKYGALFDSAVKQCNEPAVLEKIAYQSSCNKECLHTLHKHHPQMDMDKPNEEGDTPLHNAAQHGDLAKVTYLVTHGAQVLRKNKFEKTPVDQAYNGLEEESKQAFKDKCSGAYYTSRYIGPTSSTDKPMHQIQLSSLPSIDVLTALQKGTQTNILSPLAHPSYKKYAKLCMKPPRFHDVIRCNAKQSEHLWNCRNYYAMMQMFKQLHKAEEEYLNPSVFQQMYNHFSRNK